MPSRFLPKLASRHFFERLHHPQPRRSLGQYHSPFHVLPRCQDHKQQVKPTPKHQLGPSLEPEHQLELKPRLRLWPEPALALELRQLLRPRRLMSAKAQR